jgi:signal transduction histidine kinase
MTRLPRSLTFRLGLFSSLWVSAGLVAGWFYASTIVTDGVNRVFNARLLALVDSLTASVSYVNGAPVLLRPISEPRFDQKLSGVYFEIVAPNGVLLTSQSAATPKFAPPHFHHSDVLTFSEPGPDGQQLEVMERDILTGDGGTMHVMVAADRNASIANISRIRRLLALGSLVIGAGLVVAMVLQTWFGLRGLRRLSRVMAELRLGTRHNLEVKVPQEVMPLFAEIDALVKQNQATVKRARDQVGNLAHALRTHLAVMQNALAQHDHDTLASELANAERLVQRNLARARAHAVPDLIAPQTDLVATLEDLKRALSTLFVERELHIELVDIPRCELRCQREDLIELLGNLMENACKWATGIVRVTAAREMEMIAISVADDGPGLASDKLKQATARGVRWDENTPGSGLGLAITSDLLDLYGGRLDLVSPGSLGGLTAIARLPVSRA